MSRVAELKGVSFRSPLTGDRLTAVEAKLFNDSHTTTPVPGIYNADCYICRDPDFAQMGLPLCKPCLQCGAHVPADDDLCDNGHDNHELAMQEIAMDSGCAGLA